MGYYGVDDDYAQHPDMVKLLDQLTEQREQREAIEMEELLETYGGRAFLWSLLCEARLHCAVPSHALDTFRNEGRRDIGIWAEGRIFTTDPNAYTLMRQEAIERDRATDSKVKQLKRLLKEHDHAT